MHPEKSSKQNGEKEGSENKPVKESDMRLNEREEQGFEVKQEADNHGNRNRLEIMKKVESSKSQKRLGMAMIHLVVKKWVERIPKKQLSMVEAMKKILEIEGIL
eukprot:Seg11811.2 transcript_id=Seg11811.2/GoldUCD/mRNA.D3Y31 product="hypothetical protein" protein_id=Seg11811.2/GoldUCD/D3Y31